MRIVGVIVEAAAQNPNPLIVAIKNPLVTNIPNGVMFDIKAKPAQGALFHRSGAPTEDKEPENLANQIRAIKNLFEANVHPRIFAFFWPSNNHGFAWVISMKFGAVQIGAF
jgi:hypothetical protein